MVGFAVKDNKKSVAPHFFLIAISRCSRSHQATRGASGVGPDVR